MTFKIFPWKDINEWFCVRIFDTEMDMRKAISEEFEIREREQPNDIDLIDALWFPSDSWQKSTNSNELLSSNWFGDMYLCVPHLTIGIVAHESLHAALTHEREREMYTRAQYLEEDKFHEERLAGKLTAILDELCAKITAEKYTIAPSPRTAEIDTGLPTEESCGKKEVILSCKADSKLEAGESTDLEFTGDPLGYVTVQNITEHCSSGGD